MMEPIKSVQELSERQMQCLGNPLKNGEKRIACLPAYSILKDPDNGGNYGHHCVDLIFVERRGDLVIDVRFFTGMYLTEPSKPLCTGFNYHSPKRRNENDYEHNKGECYFLKGKCFSRMGSAMYGDVILGRLLHEGSAGVWDEIDKAFTEGA